MLFLVPDEPSAPDNARVKVELDIEDAPFLQEASAPKRQEKEAEKPAPAAPATPAPSLFQRKLAALLGNKKRLAVIGGALLFLLLAPITVSLFLGKTPSPPPVQEPVRKLLPDEPPREDTPAGPRFLFKGEPFLIERRGSEGEIRFLRCRFVIPTDNPVLYAELQAKNIALRDAIYYYIINKPVTFLSDNTQTETMKKDIISVINEQVSAEKIQELYIEEYLVTRL